MKKTGKVHGKPYAGNPHVRFDEGEVAPAATPRRGSLLYKLAAVLSVLVLAGTVFGEPMVKEGETLAFLGDSITQQGHYRDGYVSLVVRGLEAIGVRVKDVRAGISGNKSNNMLARLDKDILSKKPNWMTLSCGINDVWHQDRGQGIDLETYKKNIAEILDKCDAAGCKVIVMTTTIFEMAKLKEDHRNIKVAAYNAWLRDEAKRRNLPLVDLNAAMWKAKDADSSLKLTRDGVHMTPTGDRFMATEILKTMGVSDSEFDLIRREAWKSVWVICRFDLKPSASVDEYIAKTREIIKVVRTERGCRTYKLLDNAVIDWNKPEKSDAHTLWMVEEWESSLALKAHLASPRLKAMAATVKPLRAGSGMYILEDVSE